MFDPSQFKIIDFSQPVFTVVGDKNYKLVEDYEVKFEFKGNLFRLFVPKNDETDGASVPQFAWSLGFIPVGLQMAAAVIHDLLYKKKGDLTGILQIKIGNAWRDFNDTWTRKQCDDLFLLLMKIAKVYAYKCMTMYIAVRTFGWLYWNKTFQTS